MRYLNISFSYKNADLEIREKLTYPNDKSVEGCLKKLNSAESINEVVLISTCNRMEIFSSCSDIEDARNHIFEMLSARAGFSVSELEDKSDTYDDSSAIHHIFKVASSLDSMVVGETQIAGQLKDAFRFSHDKGYCDKKIARAIRSAFKCAAKVRNATDISSKPVSVASVAVSKLKSVLDDLTGKKTLIIGVGEMSEITAKHMISSGADVYIMNRTKQKAETLAEECGAKVIDYGQLDSAVNQFEIIFTATSSNVPIITNEMIDLCNYQRYWFDLAVPRDISCAYTGMIKLYTVDDLTSIVDNNKSQREKEARKAHGIVGRSVVEFFEWLDTLNVEPMIKEIYQKAYNVAQIESSRVCEKGFIPKEYESEARKMAEQTLKRFLHDMTTRMRDATGESKNDSISGMIQIISNASHDEVPDKYKKMKEKNNE
ncbi:MAG: glutamyl-tRNA reductase [Campylobacterota bacterium]|nr:glutamyl-tRNA reductase [Campylobacterota bacterium]